MCVIHTCASVLGRYTRLLSILLFSFFVSHYVNPQLLAEETPCEPCSSANAWSAVSTHTTSQAIPGSACTLIISYRTRTCSATGEPQIKIESIAPQPNCSTVTTYSPEEIAVLAMGDLLQANPMSFAPTLVGTTKDWAVVRPACWQKNLVSGIIEGCTTDCCTNRVTAEIFACEEQTLRGLSDHGYSNTIAPPSGPLPVGCSCTCDNIFKRYREIIKSKTTTP